MITEDFETKLLTPIQVKERELREVSNKALEAKQLLKEKQTKAAQDCLLKIQSELINLSTL